MSKGVGGGMVRSRSVQVKACVLRLLRGESLGAGI